MFAICHTNEWKIDLLLRCFTMLCFAQSKTTTVLSSIHTARSTAPYCAVLRAVWMLLNGTVTLNCNARTRLLGIPQSIFHDFKHGCKPTLGSPLFSSHPSPQSKLNLVYFSLKIWHLVTTNLKIFLIIKWPKFKFGIEEHCQDVVPKLGRVLAQC